MPLESALALYESGGRDLFLTHDNWTAFELGSKYADNAYQRAARMGLSLYFQVEPGQTWENRGTVPIFSQDLTMKDFLVLAGEFPSAVVP